VEDIPLDLLPDDSEDDFDWEEVEVPQAQPTQAGLELNLNEAYEQQSEQHLEIVLKRPGKEDSTKYVVQLYVTSRLIVERMH